MRVSSFLKAGSKTLDAMEKLFGPVALRSYVAEFISTFLFVFAGVGSCISTNKLGASDTQSKEMALLIVAMAHAFALSAAVYVASGLSGGHVNPSVTFSLVVSRQISILTGICYIVAQLLGSTLACVLLMLATAGQAIPTQDMAEEMTGFGGTLMELIATFALVYTVHVARDPLKGTDGVVGSIMIGFIVGANILAAGSFSGGSLNPARSFGPSIVTGSFRNHWIYWTGPMVGGGLAGFVYQRFMSLTNNQVSLSSEAAMPV
ncbi:hypothetical protein Scep_026936 [Stephania cephalantha]|uniref:Uncharacterized protein n=1 Tax=Stephania cephalantha TaxID=152367 RepID=A0AAP0EPA2_9MAGN